MLSEWESIAALEMVNDQVWRSSFLFCFAFCCLCIGRHRTKQIHRWLCAFCLCYTYTYLKMKRKKTKQKREFLSSTSFCLFFGSFLEFEQDEKDYFFVLLNLTWNKQKKNVLFDSLVFASVRFDDGEKKNFVFDILFILFLNSRK